MDSKCNPMANLANLVQQGKAGTEQRFWQEMSPQLERMVRRVLRFGAGRSVLEQKIGREVQQLTTNPNAGLDREKIVGLVTRRLFEKVVGGLKAGPSRPHMETKNFAAAPDHPTRIEWGAMTAST